MTATGSDSPTVVDLDNPNKYLFTHAEWVAAMKARFGESPARWAFICPACGDVADGIDWKDADPDHYADRLGRECIGRQLGALSKQWPSAAAYRKDGGRGCDWAAFGLFRGPLVITMPTGGEVAAFRPAPRPKSRP